jgi:hypothetical protein
MHDSRAPYLIPFPSRARYVAIGLAATAAVAIFLLGVRSFFRCDHLVRIGPNFKAGVTSWPGTVGYSWIPFTPSERFPQHPWRYFSTDPPREFAPKAQFQTKRIQTHYSLSVTHALLSSLFAGPAVLLGLPRRLRLSQLFLLVTLASAYLALATAAKTAPPTTKPPQLPPTFSPSGGAFVPPRSSGLVARVTNCPPQRTRT